MKSHTPVPQPNLKVAQIITGPTDLSYLNLGSINNVNKGGTSVKNKDSAKYPTSDKTKAVNNRASNNSKSQKATQDFSPFENFLMNLLQKNNPQQ